MARKDRQALPLNTTLCELSVKNCEAVEFECALFSAEVNHKGADRNVKDMHGLIGIILGVHEDPNLGKGNPI